MLVGKNLPNGNVWVDNFRITCEPLVSTMQWGGDSVNVSSPSTLPPERSTANRLTDVRARHTAGRAASARFGRLWWEMKMANLVENVKTNEDMARTPPG